MNKSIKSSQAGFTLIELIVVIVILGILAATALPRFSSMGADARIAKMQAAAGALRSAAAMTHAQWLVAGSRAETADNSTWTNSIVVSEGTRIAYRHGYPDVGGDGFTNNASDTATSGIVAAAGGLADYSMTATAARLTIRPDDDTNRNLCTITFTEAADANTPPAIMTAGLTAANCD